MKRDKGWEGTRMVDRDMDKCAHWIKEVIWIRNGQLCSLDYILRSHLDQKDCIIYEQR